MNIPSDINPLVRSKTKPEEDSNLTIYEVTTTGSNNLYRVAIGDYEGQTCTIDWGDGSSTETASSTSLRNYDHTYTTAGTYTVQIIGNISLIRFGTASSTYGKYVTKIIQVNKTFTSCEQMFSYCAITTLPEGFTIPEGITNCGYMFNRCYQLTTLPEGFTIGDSVTNCGYMFNYCQELTTLPEGFTIGDSVTNCYYMFNYCMHLTALPEGFTIGDSVTNCEYMFSNCRFFTTLPKGFTIGDSVTNCYYMFNYCRQLTTLPDGFTIGDSVTNCRYMFSYCAITTLPDGFTIGDSVTNCSLMFENCTQLTTLPDGFTIGDSVTNCYCMFYYCSNLITNIENLFTKWTVKTRNVKEMFHNNSKITGTAPANLLWNNTSITSFENCFYNCKLLDNYYQIPYSWGGGGAYFADKQYIVIKEDEEIQLAAIGGGTLTFSSDDLPAIMNLTADGQITNFTENGTYEFNVTCSSSYGTEDSATITIIVNNTLLKTENNLTSNDSSDFVKVYDQGNNSNAFKAMDGNLTTKTNSEFNIRNSAIFRIDFLEPIIVSYIELKTDTNSGYNYYLQASNDGSEWVRIYSDVIPAGFDGALIINTNQPYQFYRLIRANSRILSLHILDNLLLQIF